jgi:ketosteroid isomerase-like protein
MSRENVEVVESAFAAWNRGGVDAFAAHTDEEIEWLEVSGRLEAEGAVVSGREDVLAGLESLLESWEEYRLEPERIEDLGDRVLVTVREVARGRRSGAEVRSLWAYVITSRNGKLIRVEAYRDPDQAFEAAGFSE